MADAAGGESRIEFRLLGDFEVASGGRSWRSAVRSSAAARAAGRQPEPPGPGRRDSRCPLAGRAARHAQSTLQSLVSRLRAELGTGGARLRLRETGYVLEADRAQVDAHRFEDLASQGRDAAARGDPGRAAELFGKALEPWRGPAFADLADAEPFRPEAARLEESRLGVIEDLAEAELTLGRPAPALARLEPHVVANPLRERAWGQRMLALYRLGRQADALRAYQSLRRLLADELGLEPTPALRQLEQQILLQSPELDGSPPEGPPPGRRRRPRPSSSPTSRPAPGAGKVTRTPWPETSAGTTSCSAGGGGRRRSRLQPHRRRAVRGLPHRLVGTGRGTGRAAGAPRDRNGPARRRCGCAWPSTPGPPNGVAARIRARPSTAPPGCRRWPPVARCCAPRRQRNSARDRLPAGVTLLDLGEHRLADLSRPERVYQLLHPDLPRAFPPLARQRPAATTCR